MPKFTPPVSQEQAAKVRLELESELARFLRQEAQAKEDLAFAEARILRIRRQLLECDGVPASLADVMRATR